MPEDSPVWFIAHFTIDDPDAFRTYERGFFPIVAAHGGHLVTYDDAPTVLEGKREAGRTAIVQFGSEEALMSWWESPEYAELASRRHASTTTHSVSVIHSPPNA